MRELLDCLAVLNKRLVFADMGEFYFLSRMTLVKDEKYFDRFDLAFSAFFSDVENDPAVFEEEAPLAVLNQLLERHFPALSAEAKNSAFTEFRKSTEKQKHDAGSSHSNQKQSGAAESGGEESSGDRTVEPELPEKGEAFDDDHPAQGEEGKSGDGSGAEQGKDGEGEGEGEDGESGEGEEGKEGEGLNGQKGLGAGEDPGQGIRDDIEMESQRSALKVWHQRQYEDYDPEVELGTRNIKMALRRLRKFARTAAAMELDLMDTIRCTARNGGFLDIKEVPERHNSVKVLLFLDVGGSMDDHIELCSQLFAAARSEFKYLEYYYFHNFIYENIWLSNDRRQEEKLNTFDLIRRFGSDYKIIFVGDANMARHEIAERGGSVEHFNGEAGAVWLKRIQDQFKKIIWLNPVEKKKWPDSYTTEMIRRLVDDHMFHLSVDGIEQAMKYLAR